MDHLGYQLPCRLCFLCQDKPRTWGNNSDSYLLHCPPRPGPVIPPLGPTVSPCHLTQHLLQRAVGSLFLLHPISRTALYSVARNLSSSECSA